MHLFSLLTTSAALFLAHANALSFQRRQTNPDWMEAMNDFKSLVRAVTFGEKIPLSHHEQPLQMMANRAENAAAVFILDANAHESPFKRKNPFKKWNGPKTSSPKRPIQKMAAAKRAATDEMALLNFLVALEEPNTNSMQVQQDLKRANERYQAIVNKRKARKLSKNKPGKNKTTKKTKKQPTSNKKMNSFMSKKPSHDNKSKDGFKLDWKGARNKITLSVAFAVIVTALFCVVVQLFRLFVKPRSGGAYDQLNRRSAYGYERIALDVDEDNEAMPLNA